MGKKNSLTLEQHCETADDLAIIQALLKQIDAKFIEFYNKSHPVAKRIRKFVANDGYISQLQSDLDDEFHKLIYGEKLWEELNPNGQGNIYYNLHRRLTSNAPLNSEGLAEKLKLIEEDEAEYAITDEGLRAIEDYERRHNEN